MSVISYILPAEDVTNKIIIFTQVRSKSNVLTEVMGIPALMDIKVVLSQFKKDKFRWIIKNDPDISDKLVFYGNQKENLVNYFVNKGVK